MEFVAQTLSGFMLVAAGYLTYQIRIRMEGGWSWW